MRSLASAAPHHLVSEDLAEFPSPFSQYADLLRDRSQLVRRADRIDIECVVRGYLTGSGWKEYQATGAVCGLRLPVGLSDGSRLDPPIFTPATKEDTGHDLNVSFDEVVARVGGSTAEALRARTLAIYEEARTRAWSAGLVLADTKFEFGWVDGALTLIDEILSPDSSRYWDRAEFEAGRLWSFDKQYVRDWLDRSGWNHEPPAPALPADVVAKTRERYLEAMRRLTGANL
jgi:phosphoribosylaminoimidazole-succinocarboxamide synthase